jgi:putative transposase
VQVYLRCGGLKVGERRLRGVMKRSALHAQIKRAFVHTTDSRHDHRVYPNQLTGRTVSDINQAWGSDLTYIRIVNGLEYLAVILDLFSRRVIGWAISRRIDAELALARLAPGDPQHAVDPARRPDFQLRQGQPVRQRLRREMKTLKQAGVYLANYETYLDVLENLPTFIEEVYNEKRVHSGIGYLTPVNSSSGSTSIPQ